MFEKVQKNKLSKLTWNLSIFTKNLLQTSKKYGLRIRNLRSETEKNLSRIRIQRSTKHRIPDLQHDTKILVPVGPKVAICLAKKQMLRIRIHMFLGLPDPDPLVRGMDPDPDPL